jgi:hypothetical protein
MLDNREIAILIWVAGLLALVLAKPKHRKPIGGVIRAFFDKKLLICWIAEICYIAAIAFSLWGWGLWSIDNLKATTIWFFTAAVVMTVRIGSDDPQRSHLRKAMRDGFAATIIAEFLVNLYVFPIAVELVILPVMAVLGAFSVMVDLKEEHKQLRGCRDAVLTLIGGALLIYISYRIWGDFDRLFRVETLIDFLLPLLMLLLFLPFLFLLAAFIVYEATFTRLRILMKDDGLRRFTKRALLTHCWFDIDRVHRWRKLYLRDRPRSESEVLESIRRSRAEVAS